MSTLTLEQLERRPDGPQSRPCPVTGTARRESALAVIGTWSCWCGEPRGHDWPGKDEQVPHPREASR